MNIDVVNVLLGCEDDEVGHNHFERRKKGPRTWARGVILSVI